MIEREEIRFVAAADWTDDARVEVQLRKRRMTMTVTEARAFRQELDVAIGEASRAADGLIREVVPAAFDLIEAMVYCNAQGSAGFCTRPDGHAGVHYAQIAENAVPYAAWGVA